MHHSEFSKSQAQRIAQVLYWIGCWVIAFDGIWLVVRVALGSTPELPDLFKSVVAHTVYAAIGAVICLSTLLTRANNAPKLFPLTCFWAVYWTFFMTSYLLHPSAECYNPVGADACQQVRSLILIVAIPASLIYCGAVGSLGSAFYQLLFYPTKKVN